MKQRRWIAIFSLLFAGLFACAMPPAEHTEHNHSAATGEDPERITIDQVLARMQRGEPIVFLDSRNVTAWEEGTIKIPDALRVGNNKQLAEVMKELPKESFIVTYCT